MPFTPTVGTTLIPNTPYDAFTNGDVTPLPLIIGNTAQEGWLFIYEAYTKPLIMAQYIVLLDLICGVKDLAPLFKEYPVPKGTKDLRDQLAMIATDEVFLCINRNATRSVTGVWSSTSSSVRSRTRGSALQGWSSGIFLYIFDHPQSFYEVAWPDMPYCWNVSCHGAELPFVFHQGDPAFFNWTAAEAALSAQMVQYWTNFAHTGNPNTSPSMFSLENIESQQISEQEALPAWPAYVSSSSQSMRFTIPQLVVDSFYDKANCDFWDSHGYVEKP